MKRTTQIFWFIICISIFFVSCSNARIRAGVGVGRYLLDSKEEKIFKEITSREQLAKDGLFFSFENGHVTTITVTSEKYSTTDNVKVGDSIKQIKNLPDSSLTSKVQLEKGDKVIPTDSDIIAFSGIRYIVNDGIITAILVVKE